MCPLGVDIPKGNAEKNVFLLSAELHVNFASVAMLNVKESTANTFSFYF